MKILNLSLDEKILDKESAPAKRLVGYGELAEKYAVIVPSEEAEEIELSSRVKVYGSGGRSKLARFLKLYQRARKILSKENFSVITIQDQYYLAFLGWRLAKKFRMGLEIQAHGFEKFSGLRKIIAHFILPRADSVRAVSQRLKKQLISEFNIAEEKITVAPVYSELGIIRAEARVKDKGGRFIFLTVGRLVPVKNIKIQIAAIKEIIKQEKNIELWVVGEGAERKELENQAARHDLPIKFFGWQADLTKFYEQADAFLLTSKSEGWGMVVIEAAGWGLPVIMTDVGCAGEVIKNGESGLVIPAGGEKELAAAMLKILTDENLRKKLGQGARAAFLSLPGREEIFSLYKESWRKAMKK